MCGRWVACCQVTNILNDATCLTCHRADDSIQVRNYRAECKASGIDPDTMEKIK